MSVQRENDKWTTTGYSDVNTVKKKKKKRLLTAACPNDRMRDNADGLKLPAVWTRDLR